MLLTRCESVRRAGLAILDRCAILWPDLVRWETVRHEGAGCVDVGPRDDGEKGELEITWGGLIPGPSCL